VSARHCGSSSVSFPQPDESGPVACTQQHGCGCPGRGCGQSMSRRDAIGQVDGLPLEVYVATDRATNSGVRCFKPFPMFFKCRDQPFCKFPIHSHRKYRARRKSGLTSAARVRANKLGEDVRRGWCALNRSIKLAASCIEEHVAGSNDAKESWFCLCESAFISLLVDISTRNAFGWQRTTHRY